MLPHLVLLLLCSSLCLSLPSPQTGALRLQQEDVSDAGDELPREVLLRRLRETPFRLKTGMQKYALDTYRVRTINMIAPPLCYYICTYY